MATTANGWRNRITRYADVPPDQLLANPKNWRIHPQHQQDALKGLIDEVGVVDTIKVQEGSDTVVDGHLRVTLALRDGVPTIPVAYVDLSDDEADLVLATFDPIAALAVADQRQLGALIADIETENEALNDLLARLDGDAPPFDPAAEWQGMPEYENDDLKPKAQLTVYFATEEDKASFSKVIGQGVTSKTRWVWHPPRPAVEPQRWAE